MTYDIFILGLAVIGISTVVLSSFKMAHCRVYPIGIVRKTTGLDNSTDAAIAPEEVSVPGAVLEIKEKGIFIELTGPNKSVLRCRHCGLIQYSKKGTRCKRCNDRMDIPSRFNVDETAGGEIGTTAEIGMEDRVDTLGQNLESHRERLQEMETRIKRLESRQAQNMRNEAEESAQPIREEFVN